MPDNIKLSEMATALNLGAGAWFYTAYEDPSNPGTNAYGKVTLGAIAETLFDDLTFPLLFDTTAKSVSGAINELQKKTASGTTAPASADGVNDDLYIQYHTAGGAAVDALFVKISGSWLQIATGGGAGSASIYSGTTAPTSATGSDNDLYVQYHTSGNENVVDALFVKLSGAWSEIATGGGSSGVELSATLYAGETALAFTDAAIVDGCKIRILTSEFGVGPTAATVSNGTLTLTFTAQQNDLGVEVIIQ